MAESLRRPMLVLAATALWATGAEACPLCGEALRRGAGASAGDPAAGFAAGVWMMLAGPLALLGSLGFALARWLAHDAPHPDA